MIFRAVKQGNYSIWYCNGTTQRVNPNVNYALELITMYQYWLIIINKYITLAQDVNNRRKWWGDGVNGNSLCFLFNFSVNLKQLWKLKVYKHKNKQLKSTNIKINTHISAPQLKKRKKKSTDEEGENKEGSLIASPGHSVALLVLISALPVYFTYYS